MCTQSTQFICQQRARPYFSGVNLHQKFWEHMPIPGTGQSVLKKLSSACGWLNVPGSLDEYPSTSIEIFMVAPKVAEQGKAPTQP
jgi:hypothetical protein